MLISKRCGLCGVDFQAASAKALYCSDQHRKRAFRQRQKAAERPESAELRDGTSHSASDERGSSLEQATLRELRAVQRDGTAYGLAALRAARRIDRSDAETGAGFAALVRVHAAALTRALESAGADDRLGAIEDELARKREARNRAGG